MILYHMYLRIVLLDASITENVRLVWMRKVNKSQVINAAKVAEIYDFITEKLPDGFDTKVGDKGSKLSGGKGKGSV